MVINCFQVEVPYEIDQIDGSNVGDDTNGDDEYAENSKRY